MRIGRLFAVSMFSVSALALIIDAEVLVPQARTVASKSEAIKAVEAFSAVLTVGQHVAGFRAPYITPLFQDAVATPAQLEATKAAASLADNAFADARNVVGALN